MCCRETGIEAAIALQTVFVVYAEIRGSSVLSA